MISEAKFQEVVDALEARAKAAESKLDSVAKHRHPIIVCNAGPGTPVGTGTCICLREIERLYGESSELQSRLDQYANALRACVAYIQLQHSEYGSTEAWDGLVVIETVNKLLGSAVETHYHYDPDHTGFCIECGADLDNPAAAV